MDGDLKNKLINIAKRKIKYNDPSHDMSHSLRVLSIAEDIGMRERADMEILVPSAIFHDVINYPKNHPKRLDSSKESAEYTVKILNRVKFSSKEKIDKIYKSILLCSFTKAQKPNFIEAAILQDADALESMGAISIMRTFASAGTMNKIFYNKKDPFCKKRNPNDKKYALDLFFTRLLVIQDRLHTDRAKQLAIKRVKFLKDFLMELEYELL